MRHLMTTLVLASTLWSASSADAQPPLPSPPTGAGPGYAPATGRPGPSIGRGGRAPSYGSPAYGAPSYGAPAPNGAPQAGPPPGPHAAPPGFVAYPAYGEYQSFNDFNRPHRLQDYSFHYLEPPPPREIKARDLVTIVVSEKSQVTQNSSFNRQRNATFKAELKEFIRMGRTGNLRPAAEESAPTIDGNLQGRLQTVGSLADSEGMTFRIQAEVVEVLPNGILVLEARKSQVSNKERWEYAFTGRARAEDVNRDNTILSEKVANQMITKTSKGKVFDSTRRPWGTRLWDKFFPF